MAAIWGAYGLAFFVCAFLSNFVGVAWTEESCSPYVAIYRFYHGKV